MNQEWSPPSGVELVGQFVKLLPCAPAHIPDLFSASHGSPQKEAVWTYLPYGPFESAESMADYYQAFHIGKPDPVVWTIFSLEWNRPVGTTALLSIVPLHGRAEVGHVWLSPELHRSKCNTEAQFLVLKYVFDQLDYRRAEWKCDSLNHASRSTASRMGFAFEGRFRQHMWVRDRNRDTDWFAITNKDWPRCRANFELWLYSDEPVSLLELNTGR
jgi:RimJ/RimL family protein N-acetyltransferase